MWTSNKINHHDMILNISYFDFATIIIEKKINNKGIVFYEINFDIYDVLNQSIVIYRLDDVEHVLKEAKSMIEDFYDEKFELNQIEINNWVEDFLTTINDY